MGKGTIISGNDDGSYVVTMEYDTTAIVDKITILNTKIADFDEYIENAETDIDSQIAGIITNIATEQVQLDFWESQLALAVPGTPQWTYCKSQVTLYTGYITELENALSKAEKEKKNIKISIKIAELRKLSAEKRKEYLENTSNVPANDNITAWCVDYTTDLTGEVGTIEHGRERTNGVNIQPGYDSNAVYDSVRDGQLVPAMAQSAPGQFVNLAMLPGTQKWKPMFRYGTITDIDFDADTCNVTLDSVTSSQQSLDINQAVALTDVGISYMECDSDVFNVGDEVVIKFTGNDWAAPVVIGFQSDPISCCWAETFYTPDYTWTFWTFYQTPSSGWIYHPPVYTGASVSYIPIVDASQVDKELILRPGGPNNALRMHLPAQGVAVGHLNYLTLGTYDDSNSIIKQSATKVRVICTDLLAECLDWQVLNQYLGSYMGVYFQGHDGTNFYDLWVLFFNTTPLGTFLSGQQCTTGTYLTEFQNVTWYNTGLGSREYSVYLPYGASNAQWVDLPVHMDINFIQVIMNIEPIETAPPAACTYHNATESMIEIDSIEIC